MQIGVAELALIQFRKYLLQYHKLYNLLLHIYEYIHIHIYINYIMESDIIDEMNIRHSLAVCKMF